MDYLKELQDLNYMQQIYGGLFSLLNKIQSNGDESLESLTSRQFMALVAILHLPDEDTTLMNIANKLGSKKQNVSRLLAHLQSRGYIEIYNSKSDKRAMNVRITEEGKKIAAKCGEKSIRFIEKMFHEFDSSELELFWGLVKKLYQYDGVEMDGYEEDASDKIDKDAALENELTEEFVRLRRAGR